MSEKRVTLSVRIQPELKQRLEEQAREQHRSVGQTLELILEQEFAAPQWTMEQVDRSASRIKRWIHGA